jgi:hypothetical protein
VAAEREDFAKEIAAADPNRLVFLDESGILTNMTRRYARAASGRAATHPSTGSASPCWAPWASTAWWR